MSLKLYNQKRHAEKIRREIAQWDHQNADDLRDLMIDFTETKAALEGEGIYIEDIDGSTLPSEPFTANFDTTGYWALDKTGYAVVGDSWDEHELSIVKIEEVRA